MSHSLPALSLAASGTPLLPAGGGPLGLHSAKCRAHGWSPKQMLLLLLQEMDVNNCLLVLKDCAGAATFADLEELGPAKPKVQGSAVDFTKAGLNPEGLGLYAAAVRDASWI